MCGKCITTLHSKVRYSQRVDYRETMDQTLKKVLNYGIKLNDVPLEYNKVRSFLKRNKIYYNGKIYIFANQNEYRKLLTVYTYRSSILEMLFKKKDDERKQKYYKQFFTSQSKILYRISLYKNKIYEIKVVTKRKYTLPLLEDKRLRKNIVNHFIKLLAGKQSFQSIGLYYDEMDEFEKKVYQKVLEIKRGQTITYKELALHFKVSVQKITGIIKRCPIPILIPTHRVVKSNGQIGCHRVSRELKKTILDFEKKNVLKESRTNLKLPNPSTEENEKEYLCYNLSDILSGLM